ncbi:Uncharacterised protein [Mycobacteroides abscessus subsp. abscessus]|nr:Uncharacterised protein [Mycobacteroides abscessus subsp. abscessus]
MADATGDEVEQRPGDVLAVRKAGLERGDEVLGPVVEGEDIEGGKTRTGVGDEFGGLAEGIVDDEAQPHRVDPRDPVEENAHRGLIGLPVLAAEALRPAGDAGRAQAGDDPGDAPLDAPGRHRRGIGATGPEAESDDDEREAARRDDDLVAAGPVLADRVEVTQRHRHLPHRAGDDALTQTRRLGDRPGRIVLARDPRPGGPDEGFDDLGRRALDLRAAAAGTVGQVRATDPAAQTRLGHPRLGGRLSDRRRSRTDDHTATELRGEHSLILRSLSRLLTQTFRRAVADHSPPVGPGAY